MAKLAFPTRLAKLAFKSKPVGKRNVVRPKKRWKYEAETGLGHSS